MRVQGGGIYAVLALVGLSAACASGQTMPDLEGTVQARVESTARAAVTPTAAPTETPQPRPTAAPTATLEPMVPMIELVVPVWELGAGYGEESSTVSDDDWNRRAGGRSIQIIARSSSGPLVVQNISCRVTGDQAQQEFEEETTLINGWTHWDAEQARENPKVFGDQPRWFPIVSPLPVGGRSGRRSADRTVLTAASGWRRSRRGALCRWT